MSTKHLTSTWSDTTNVAALSQVQSGWIDLSKKSATLWVTRTSTSGTYVFEVDWSRDGGSTTIATDTVTTVAGVKTEIAGKHRWVRLRVKNTHATLAFTAHSTAVVQDAGVGR